MTGSYNAVLVPVNPHLFFKGRPGDLRLGEWVKEICDSKDTSTLVALFGCPDDKGITLNLGRPGASLGPDEIRKAFYKMAYPMDGSWESLTLVDSGNISPSADIHETHQRAYQAAKELSRQSGCLILLGGGHDFAAPGFSGAVAGFRTQDQHHSWGLVNIDPHLDVREPIDGKPHSGSSFRHLLESKVLKGENLVQFGCRENRNSIAHYQYCREKKVKLLPLEQLKSSSEPTSKIFNKLLGNLGRKVDRIGVTLDIDSCSEVMGSSAANTIGFSIRELFECARLAGAHPKTHYFEIAEVSPPLDSSGKTSWVAAELLYGFLCGRSEWLATQNSSVSTKRSHKTLKKPKNKRN